MLCCTCVFVSELQLSPCPALQMPDPIAPRPVGGAGPAAGGGSSSGELGPGGVRLSWKHDVYDAAAGPEQAAGAWDGGSISS